MLFYKKLFKLLSTFFLLLSFPVFAGPDYEQLPGGAKVILLNEHNQGEMLGKVVSIYEDPTKQLQLKDILKSSVQSQFQNTNSEGLNLGLSNSYYWVRMDVKHSDLKDEDWLLEIAYPIMDSIEFYFKEKNVWKRKIYGDYLPFDSREINHRHFLIHLNVSDASIHTFYLKVYVKGTLEVPLQLKTKEHFLDSNAHKELLYGLFFGALLIMAAFNFFIFLSLRDGSYLFYVFNILSSVVIVSSLSGHGFQYLWPEAPILGNHLLIIALFSWNASAIFFAKTFLSNGKLPEKLKKILNIYSWIVLSLVVLLFLKDYFITVQLLMFSIVVTCLLVIVAGIYSTLHGNHPAWYFTVAWGIYLLGNSTRVLSNIGWIPTNFWTVHGFKLGAAFELVLLTLALGDRYSRIRREKEQTQYRLLKLQKETNENLERKVEERTEEVEEKKRVLEEFNREITDSIRYAQKIQEAILPDQDKIKSYLENSFIYYRPKDIVSGDFYWFAVEDNKIFFAVADCTGHGVPGALMSMLGSQLLNQIVRIHKIHEPADILLHLHFSINRTLRQGGKASAQDGMDMALVVIDKDNGVMEFAGANNPLIYFSKGELQLIKGDRRGVGETVHEEVSFTNHKIKIEEDLACYMFTDGVQDQFGGPQGKKFLQRRVKEFLEQVQDQPMNKQLELLDKSLSDWKGNLPQVDDILITGFKVSPAPENNNIVQVEAKEEIGIGGELMRLANDF